jgi:hypothetical protein
MTTARRRILVHAGAACSLAFACSSARASEPLASWNDGPTKARIVAFVQSATDEVGKDYLPPGDRIAVFDNDGTLWSELPMYFQLAFAIDRAFPYRRSLRVSECG